MCNFISVGRVCYLHRVASLEKNISSLRSVVNLGGGDPGDLVLIIPSFKPVLVFSKIIKCIYTTMIPKNKNKNKKERKFIQVHRGITSIEICLSRTIILCLVNYQVKYAIWTHLVKNCWILQLQVLNWVPITLLG